MLLRRRAGEKLDSLVTAVGATPPEGAPAPGAAPAHEVVLVHRPKYDDWTLPKGKAKAGEPLAATAVREVREETGLTIRLGPPLRPLGYPVVLGRAGSRPGRTALKRVAWWRGEIVAQQARTADADEIDDVVWLPADRARERLTYPDERGLLDEALALPATTPLLLVRHAWAVSRANWAGPDRERPLTEVGETQAVGLRRVLAAYGVDHVVTSPARRCRDTVAGYAATLGASPLDGPERRAGGQRHARSAATAGRRPTVVEILSEEAGKADPAGLAAFIVDVARAVPTVGPTAVCLHRPVLPVVLAALGLPVRPLDPAQVLVVHLDRAGQPLATEWPPAWAATG